MINGAGGSAKRRRAIHLHNVMAIQPRLAYYLVSFQTTPALIRLILGFAASSMVFESVSALAVRASA